jgi:two-component system response regulator HydG
LRLLKDYAWPGNVRELENVVERVVALSANGELDLSMVPTASEHPPTSALTLKQRVEAYEKGVVVETLQAARGNRTEAARLLGISRVTLHDKLHKYGLTKDPDEG